MTEEQSKVRELAHDIIKDPNKYLGDFLEGKRNSHKATLLLTYGGPTVWITANLRTRLCRLFWHTQNGLAYKDIRSRAVYDFIVEIS